MESSFLLRGPGCSGASCPPRTRTGESAGRAGGSVGQAVRLPVRDVDEPGVLHVAADHDVGPALPVAEVSSVPDAHALSATVLLTAEVVRGVPLARRRGLG